MRAWRCFRTSDRLYPRPETAALLRLLALLRGRADGLLLRCCGGGLGAGAASRDSAGLHVEGGGTLGCETSFAGLCSRALQSGRLATRDTTPIVHTGIVQSAVRADEVLDLPPLLGAFGGVKAPVAAHDGPPLRLGVDQLTDKFGVHPITASLHSVVDSHLHCKLLLDFNRRRMLDPGVRHPTNITAKIYSQNFVGIAACFIYRVLQPIADQLGLLGVVIFAVQDTVLVQGSKIPESTDHLVVFIAQLRHNSGMAVGGLAVELGNNFLNSWIGRIGGLQNNIPC
mmetsp:Transcript_39055/g.103244  ORF Transcript_39055/g.103244 Transcript_39055/m.103244 type:complete len:284 (-) Transcript_39055:747-1598(-)